MISNKRKALYLFIASFEKVKSMFWLEEITLFVPPGGPLVSPLVANYLQTNKQLTPRASWWESFH